MCKQHGNPVEFLTARLLLLNIDLKHRLAKKAPLELVTFEVAACLSQAGLGNCRFSSRWGFGCSFKCISLRCWAAHPMGAVGMWSCNSSWEASSPLFPAGVLGCARNSSGCLGKVVSVTLHIWKCEFWNSAVWDAASWGWELPPSFPACLSHRQDFILLFRAGGQGPLWDNC